MGEFIIPDWVMLQPVPPPPPPDSRVARAEKIANDTRVESELNRFIASKQDAMFNNPDAFYRTQGENAIHAAPVARKNLEQLRDNLLDGLANDYQRKRLGAALDAQMTVTRGGIARHVAEQSLVWQRQTALDRIDLLAKEAALHHSDDDLIDVLGATAANAGRAHARVGDATPLAEIEDRAAASARSRVLGAAIQARLAAGDAESAGQLYDRVRDQLDDVRPPFGDPIRTGEDSPSALSNVETAAAPNTPLAECREASSEKYAQGLMVGPRGVGGSNMPSLMRICIRDCLRERGIHDF